MAADSQSLAVPISWYEQASTTLVSNATLHCLGVDSMIPGLSHVRRMTMHSSSLLHLYMPVPT